eukprot:CAMPEP_0204363046 /NCGR_PEP_ID=MMETSP0469-20131031/40076_1 /ASSEMBLY_ACC=CAM_ASM_000384 /TAXON_ID=2969 /ORGANISM="Oxyrrhis marina" /LENGTH=147 /DNA_ID=CAMNT_0051351739 /DNA_START=116 /DNA_END=556 /DNA_ORIENTATION=-
MAYWWSAGRPIRSTVLQTIMKRNQTKTFSHMVNKGGLIHEFSLQGPYTFIVPTEEAMGKIKPAALQKLNADADKLATFIRHHVVPGQFVMKQLLEQQTVETLAGQPITFSVSGSFETRDRQVLVNDHSKITRYEHKASNGIIYFIDR